MTSFKYMQTKRDHSTFGYKGFPYSDNAIDLCGWDHDCDDKQINNLRSQIDKMIEKKRRQMGYKNHDCHQQAPRP